MFRVTLQWPRLQGKRNAVKRVYVVQGRTPRFAVAAAKRHAALEGEPIECTAEPCGPVVHTATFTV